MLSYIAKFASLVGPSSSGSHKVYTVSDLGVRFDSKLCFSDHMNEKINKAYSVLGVIKRNFRYMDKNTFTLLYKAMVRPHLEYANAVWCPYKKR